MNLKMIDDIYPSMPWDLIDNVVFDIGNVLLSFDTHGLVDSIIGKDNPMHERLHRAVFRSPYWIYQDMGICNIPEAFELMISTEPELEKEIRALSDIWVALKKPIPEGVRTLEACKARGKKLFVLSNYGDDAFEGIEKYHSFLSYFDGKIVSARVHLIKPSPEIYRYVTDTYSLDPARTLFIDDTHVNVAGAIAQGWHGLCFNYPGKLDKFFV